MNQDPEYKDGFVMGKKTIGVLASFMLGGVTLVGCQSSDSGSGSRMMAKQPTYVNPPMNNYASTMPGNKSLGISDTTTRPGMSTSGSMPQTGSSIQQTGVGQVATPTSGTQTPIATAGGPNLNSQGPAFDQSGQMVSRPMGNSASSSTAPGPVPPSAPGNYTIPSPTTYTPPANTTVPTRKPGDDL
jgi:hypothetical protein